MNIKKTLAVLAAAGAAAGIPAAGAGAADTGWTTKPMYDYWDTNQYVGDVDPGTTVDLVCWLDSDSTRWFRVTAPTHLKNGDYMMLTDFMLASDISNQYDVGHC